MSASLVGSEMCIRDSPAAAAGCKDPQKPGIAVLSSRDGGKRPALVHKPVSYTHLTLPTICSV
eukprot:714971-Alexandrium_andersonii.AAC.1